MKMITAYIRPFMLEEVADALRMAHVHGMTVLDCRGFGRRTEGDSPHYLDKGVKLGFAPKVKIEIVCQDGMVDQIVRTIQENAHTGRHGDGKVFILDVHSAANIRTGETGEGILPRRV